MKDATQVDREAVEAAMNTSYKHGVLDTETHLVEEVVIVCRDYVTESWGIAMDQAEVPANYELRRVKNIFYQKIFERI